MLTSKQRLLLICLIEELAEVQQAVTKALRFGLNKDYLPDGASLRSTNKNDITKELNDVYAVLTLLDTEGIIDAAPVPPLIENKITRLIKQLKDTP